MPKIVFSLTAHENIECVYDQIEKQMVDTHLLHLLIVFMMIH